MDEIGFRYWLKNTEIPKKIQSDYISRLKKLEHAICVDIDEQYACDKCASILPIFSNKGINSEMQKLSPSDLPIGKYYLSTYKLALKKYIEFLSSVNKEVK